MGLKIFHCTQTRRLPEYDIWRRMRQRCQNPKADCYEYYGGRGILVCDRWSNFKLFLKDMGFRPLGMELERIDNNGNYEPSNCKWATRIEQLRNRRNAKFLSWQGQTHLVSEWARILGKKPQVLRGRLQRGWSVERTLST